MKLGWAFFCLAVVVMVAYGLNRGIFIGTSIDSQVLGGTIIFAKHCRYLFPSGIHLTSRGAIGYTRSEAESKDSSPCPLFDPDFSK